MSTRDRFIVRVWPDRTACPVEDICPGDFDWKSDDFMDVDANDPAAIDKLEPQLRAEIIDLASQ